MALSRRLVVCISICVFFHAPFLSNGQASKKSDILNYFSKKSDAINNSRFKGQPAPSKQLLAILVRQARWDDEAGDLNPGKLRLRFEKVDSRAAEGVGIPARYRVFADGAPENKVFAFNSLLVDDTLNTDPRDIYVNGQGLLMLHPPTPEQEMLFKAGDDEFDVTPTTS